MKHVLQRLRRYLVTGLVVIAPIGVTVYVLSWLFRRLGDVLRPLEPLEAARLSISGSSISKTAMVVVS